VVGKSASAKEVRELWLYVQERLSRLTHDARLSPGVRPAHFATGALSSLDYEPPPEFAEEFEDDRLPAAPRRPERRVATLPFGGPDRRAHPFGRRVAP
jgi:hypothetical protein